MNIEQELRQLQQVKMPKDIFADIQSDLHKSQNKKHRWINFSAIVAVLLLTVVFFQQRQLLNNKDQDLHDLAKRTLMLEQLLVKETPHYTMEGSVVTEKIANLELWLAKLDEDIKTTKDKNKLSQLMTTKLELLANMVMLQRKINQSPSFLKIKPYVI